MIGTYSLLWTLMVPKDGLKVMSLTIYILVVQSLYQVSGFTQKNVHILATG